MESSGAIFAARLTSSGGVLDPVGTRLSDIISPMSSTTGQPEPGGYYLPRVATNGIDYFVVWHQPSSTQPKKVEVFGVRLSGSGAALGAPFRVMPMIDDGLRAPFVFFDGANYVVFWDLDAVRVSTSGTVLDVPPIKVPVLFSAFASNGSSYLVAFEKSTSSQSGFADVYGLRFDKDLQPIDALPFPISTANGDQRSASVASDGADFFVVWDDERNAIGGKNTADIYGSRVTAAGKVLNPDGMPIALDTIGKQRSNRGPAIAYSPAAKRYLVAWERGGGSDGRIAYAAAELRGVEIERTGTVRAPGSFQIVATPYHPWSSPSIRPLDGAKMLVAYERLDTQAPYGSRRVHAKVVDLDPTAVVDAGVPADGGPDGGSVTLDADAGADGGSGAKPGGSGDSSCGCRMAGARRETFAAPFFVGLALLVRRRRRNSRV